MNKELYKEWIYKGYLIIRTTVEDTKYYFIFDDGVSKRLGVTSTLKQAKDYINYVVIKRV